MPAIWLGPMWRARQGPGAEGSGVQCRIGGGIGPAGRAGYCGRFLWQSGAGGAEPIAQAYAGHQFGGFSPQLGDGSALLLGEVIDRAGRRRDIAMKGSCPTPFARRGDGLAAIGPVLREYLMGEAMAALGVPTSRALAAVATGRQVLRERPLPGAVLTRVAASHLRVGTFQFLRRAGRPRCCGGWPIMPSRGIIPIAWAANPYLAFFDACRLRRGWWRNGWGLLHP